MRKVIHNICISLNKQKRKIVIIYNNPVCSEVIEEEGSFVKSREYSFNGSLFLVYENSEDDLQQKT